MASPTDACLPVERLRCKAKKGAILRLDISLDSAQCGLVPQAAIVRVLESGMLGAKARVRVVAADDAATTGWASRSVFEAAPLATHATLAAGVAMPLLGFGTWKLPGTAKTTAVVRAALRAGYRHVDTATIYGNERAVGAAIRGAIADGEVARHEIFVTTKLWGADHGAARVEAALRRSLALLGLERVDLYLIHCPFTGSPIPSIRER